MKETREIECCHCRGLVVDPDSSLGDDEQSCTYCVLSGKDFFNALKRAKEP